MEQEKNSEVVIAPLIDAHTPPVSADSVILGEASTGAIRLSCFSGDAFVIREDVISLNGTDKKRLWVRPVCVVDISPEAVKFMESYLLLRLSSNSNELQHAVDNFPDFMKKLHEKLNDALNDRSKGKNV